MHICVVFLSKNLKHNFFQIVYGEFYIFLHYKNILLVNWCGAGKTSVRHHWQGNWFAFSHTSLEMDQVGRNPSGS